MKLPTVTHPIHPNTNTVVQVRAGEVFYFSRTQSGDQVLVAATINGITNVSTNTWGSKAIGRLLNSIDDGNKKDRVPRMSLLKWVRETQSADYHEGWADGYVVAMEECPHDIRA